MSALGFCSFFALALLSAAKFSLEFDPIWLFRILYNLVFASAFLLRNQPIEVDHSPLTFVITTLHWLLPLGITATGATLIAPSYALIITVIGSLISAVALLDLWQSFGVLPADRGVVTCGAYRFVRHPIYSGYFLTLCGWNLLFFSPGNFVILVLFVVFAEFRTRREEEVLGRNISYRSYKRQVPEKFLPWVF